MALIEVRNVTKKFSIPSVRRDTVREHVLGLLRPRRFERLTVLDDVSFDVPEGSTVGIMGRNGSGKSTLLKILSGIYQPDAGSVAVGAPVTPILELGVGWNPELDAIDNILLVGTVMGIPLAEMRAATSQILEFAELTRFARLELKHYSSGMAARLAYAVAFAAVRPILILDEIFAVGDASFQARCEERYRALRGAGHTMLLVSHDPSTVAEFCDRGLLLEGGRVVLDDTAKRVADAYKRLLLGTPLDDSTATADRVVATGGEPPPRVSVLVPCYDLGAFLDEAVTSVLAQTYQDVEIIVVDDGSTDPETVALLSDYERPRTRVVRTTHRGLAAARNAALEAARGEYVCFLDADDKLEPTYLEKAVAALDADESLSFVSCWVRFFGDEDWTWRQDACDLPTLLAECTLATSALVRRSDVLAAGGFDGAMAQGYEDWDLWISLLERGCRGVIIPEVLLLYRRRSCSMSSEFRRPEVHRELFRRLIAKHRPSYAAHVTAVFGHREGEQWRLAAETHSLEVDLETRLRPEIARRRQELDLRLGRSGPERAG